MGISKTSKCNLYAYTIPTTKTSMLFTSFIYNYYSCAVWLCQTIYYWICLTQTYLMHILLQLIPSKAAVFFISDENLGWLPISLLVIISIFFDLDYDCSVRHTHLFISFAQWDGLFWRLHRLMHIKNGSRIKLESCESAHMAVALTQVLHLQPPPAVWSTNYLSISYAFFFYLWMSLLWKKKNITSFKPPRICL